MSKRLIPLAVLLAGPALSAFAPAAHADLKVVQEMSVTGLPNAAAAPGAPDLREPIVTTTFFKGDKSRVETSGTILINSGGPNAQQMTLVPATKTYYVTPSVSDTLKAMPGFGDQFKFSATGNVRKTDVTRTILGKTTIDYKFYVAMKMSMPALGASAESMMPTITMSGDQWTTDSLDISGTLSGSQTDLLGKTLGPLVMGGMSDIVKTMSKIKGFPLLGTMSMSITFPKGSDLGAAMAKAMPSKMVMTNEVKSLSEDPLPDDLFIIPTDYTKVDAPANPLIPAAPAAPAPAPAKQNL